MTYDMELVIQNRRLRGLVGRHIVKRFPHIHHRKADASTPRRPKPVIELSHAHFGTILPSKPDGSATNQIAHHDAEGNRFPANRDFIDTNYLGSRCAYTRQLRPHILLVQLLDRVPIQVQIPCHILHCFIATTAANVERKPFCIKRVVGKKIQSLPFHIPATPANHTSSLDFQIDTRIGLGAVVGVAAAAASRASCVSDKQKLGYLALDEAGSVGVVLPEDPKAAPLVVSVRDGSEAQKAGIQAGDEIVGINDLAPADTQETKAWLFGKIADPVKVALKRLEQQLEFLIKRETLAKATGQS